MNIRQDAIKRRGFGSMTKERIKEIASLGGKTSHTRGTAYVWTTDTARAAGIKGLETRRKQRAGAGCGSSAGNVGIPHSPPPGSEAEI